MTTEIDQKRVLIVSTLYPPTSRVGAFRVAKFVKYLPEFGWEPYVIRGESTTTDEATHEFPAARRRAQAIYQASPIGTAEPNTAAGLPWLPTSAAKTRRIVSKHDIDVIFHTGGPFLPMLARPLMKRLTGVPYVVDLRDPWSLAMTFDSYGDASPVYSMLTRFGEPAVIRDAARVTCATEAMKRGYANRYPDERETFEVIQNGFDPDDYGTDRADRTDAFRIVYPGKFYGTMEPFFEAFSEFVESYPDSTFVHMGRRDETVEATVNSAGCRSNVECRGYVDMDTVSAETRAADVGLAVGRDTLTVQAKIFDFVACNTPILALEPESSAMGAFVDRFDRGFVTRNDDPDEIYAMLERLRTLDATGLDEPEVRNRYTRRRLTRKLATILDEVTDRERPSDERPSRLPAEAEVDPDS